VKSWLNEKKLKLPPHLESVVTFGSRILVALRVSRIIALSLSRWLEDVSRQPGSISIPRMLKPKCEFSYKKQIALAN